MSCAGTGPGSSTLPPGACQGLPGSHRRPSRTRELQKARGEAGPRTARRWPAPGCPPGCPVSLICKDRPWPHWCQLVVWAAVDVRTVSPGDTVNVGRGRPAGAQEGEENDSHGLSLGWGRGASEELGKGWVLVGPGCRSWLDSPPACHIWDRCVLGAACSEGGPLPTPGVLSHCPSRSSPEGRWRGPSGPAGHIGTCDFSRVGSQCHWPGAREGQTPMIAE